MSSWYDQTQINRYHRPSNAAIRLSLSLNLKCPPCRSPGCKYAHVWLWGQRWWQELGRNAYFREETGAAVVEWGGGGGSANHASGQRHSGMHAVTHQRWTIKWRGEREGTRRKWMISLAEVWGLWWTDMQVLISRRKEIVAWFANLWTWSCPQLGHRVMIYVYFLFFFLRPHRQTGQNAGAVFTHI